MTSLVTHHVSRIMKTYKIGRLAGLQLSAAPSAVMASVVLWLLLSSLAFWLLRLPLGTAVLGGLLGTWLHWFSEIMHHLGHAWAARRVGFPMAGLRLWFLLGVSLYPRDEGDLPATIHIRRALGGPLLSLLLSILGASLALLLRASGGLAYWLALFFCLENLFVFSLGALLPLGFTDGNTLLEWWPKRQ